MRSTRHWVIGLLGCLIMAAPAYAEEEEDNPAPDNGRSIIVECTSPDSQVETGCLQFLTGFLSGWSATLEAARRANVPMDRLAAYCLPDRITLGDMRNAIVKGLSEVPKTRQEKGNVLMIEILQKTYPCPPPGKPQTSPAGK